MSKIPQTQIALYLQDYSELTSLMLEHPKAEPYFLFEMYLTKENRQHQATTEYYQQMLDIAYIFTKMKLFSIAEDYNLKQQNDFIDNDDLDLSFLEEYTTGNLKAYSKKQILQILRDVFQHTEENKELYKIPFNCKYIEFSFKKTAPIKIKLPIEKISSLTSVIGKTTKTFQFFSFDEPNASTIKDYLENLKLTRHYFPKKVKPETIDSVFTLQSQNKHEEAITEVKSIEKRTEKELTLSPEQKNSILKNIESLINNKIITLEELKENFRDIIIILINQELPLPVLKLDNYLLDSLLIGTLLPSKRKSYGQMYNDFFNYLDTNEPNPINKHENIITKYRQLLFKTYMPNAREKESYSSLLFAEYIISNFKPEEEYIEIDNKSIEYKKLRNSLVHGRWHTKDENIVFYDASPKTQSETDYNWSIELNINELNSYCKNILKNKLEKPKQKQKTIFDIKI